jgi:glycerol-3-phosphate acyltransferase PlsY
MDLLLSSAISLIGYLIGSISFSRLIGKIVLPREDLESSTVKVEGTDESFTFRSVSATTIRARAGARYGIITSILDISKAAIPVILVVSSLGTLGYAYLMSVFIILGHDFPIYYRFKGGRGVSCLLGSLVVFNWVSIPVAMILSLAIGLLVIDDAFFAYLTMPVYLIPWTLLTTGASLFLAYALVVNGIYWGALMPEIREYLIFRRTAAYKKAKEARHERTRRRISKLLAKLRIKKK